MAVNGVTLNKKRKKYLDGFQQFFRKTNVDTFIKYIKTLTKQCLYSGANKNQ